jgi:hypothetical protein
MRCFLVVGALTALLSSTAKSEAFTLALEGRPIARIVVCKDATELERQAASELQRYVKLMSGAELPVVAGSSPGPEVLIGRSPYTAAIVGQDLSENKIGYDGAILRTAGDKLVVAGAHKGQMYAVYELLKRLGCRFYLPHPYGEVIPQNRTVAVGELNWIHKPDFVHRVFWHDGSTGPGLAHPEWYDSWATKVYQGGPHIFHGHNYYGFCPPGRYFATHPEYFPMDIDKDGNPVRIPRGQLCLSNPDVVQLAVDAAIARFDSRPDQLGYSVSSNDCKGWCCCDKCKAMDSPDPKVAHAWRVLRFANEVAEAVAKKYPDKKLTYVAEYMNLPGPPVGLKAHPMVLPVIVNRYDMMHSIYDSYVGDSSVTGVHYNVEYRARWDEWDKIASQMMVYEWVQHGEAPVLPSPMIYTIGERIKYYRRHNVIAYTGQLIGRSPVNDLAVYIGSQMLWDSSQNPRQMLEEFFRLYFAEASDQMRNYYRMLNETTYFSDDNRGCYAPTSAWTPELIGRLYAKLAEADAVATQDIVKKRLDRERKSLVVTDLCASACALMDQWTKNKNETTRAAFVAKADEAIAYLKSISGEDVVSDVNLVENMKALKDARDE